MNNDKPVFFKNKKERIVGYIQLIGVILFIVAVYFMSVSYGHAQILNPNESQQAYTTADPINPDRLGLATINGRYSVSLVENCDGVDVGQNILIYPNAQIPPWLITSALDGMENGACIMLINGRMSETPCFLNFEAVCDVTAESD